VRTADACTGVAVPAYELFSSTEILGLMALERNQSPDTSDQFRDVHRHPRRTTPAMGHGLGSNLPRA
jgi:hypothetical protein